jgi:hypothetical protein
VAAAPAPAAAPAQPAAPAAPARAPAPASAEPTGSPQALLAEASNAATGEDWETARAALDRLGTQTADPAVHKQAVALAKRVDSERQAALAFARFDEAQNAKNYQVAVARYAEIPADSIYKKRASSRYEETRTLLVNAHFTAAEQARAAGRCAEFKQEADEVVRLDAGKAGWAKDMGRLCKPHAEPIAALHPTRPRATGGGSAQAFRQGERADRAERTVAERSEPSASKRVDAPAAVAEPEVDADTLMKQAREAWVKQQCGAAVDLSRRALRAHPGMNDAYQIIGACSCSLKDSDGAARAYSKLDDKSRNLVRTLCQRNGIALGGE